MVNFGLAGASGSITVEEIQKLYDKIRNYFQRDKVSVCLGLKVHLANIVSWYDDSVTISGEMIDGKYRSRGEFYKYTHQHKRAPVSESSFEFIYEVLSPYEERILASRDNDNVPRWGQLKDAMVKFQTLVMSAKLRWLKETEGKENVEVDSKEVEKWIPELKEHRKRIESLVSDLMRDFKCEPILGQEDLIKKIRNYLQR